MQPQGSALTNVDYINQLTADIDSIDACAALQNLTNQALATAQAEISAIEAQIAALLPLITIPTSLSSVIAWAAAQANLYLGPYLKLAAQLAETVAAMQRLVAAIQAAEQRLTHCTIVVPPLTVAGVSTPVVAVSAHA